MTARGAPCAVGSRRGPLGSAAFLAWVAVLTATTAACAQEVPADPTVPPAHVLGCYDVVLGPWTVIPEDHPVQAVGSPPADDSLFYVIPPRVRLSDEPVPYFEPDHPAWSAAAPPGALPVGRPHQGWGVAANGRISLGYSDGMAGLGGTLAPDGDGWKGPMEAWSDLGGVTRWERQVTLSRVDCASPPPVTDASVWLLPRTVELEGGLTLALDEPPPPGLPTYERPRHAPGVDAGTVGLFAGADTVVMVLRDGRVALLELTFLPPATPDALLERLTAAYGPGHAWGLPGRPPDDPAAGTGTPVTSYSWDGRITVLDVAPRTPGGFRVILNDPRLY